MGRNAGWLTGAAAVSYTHLDVYKRQVNDAVYEIIQEVDGITRDKVLEYAERFKICPFEFCLDTVSYTHLDVYKRQGQENEDCRCTGGVCRWNPACLI